MLWLIIARDGTDADAPARRQAVRERHLQEIRPHVAAGTVTYAAAMLDASGAMRGSMLVLEAPDEATARALIDGDVYTTSGVWRHYEIHPIKRAF
jgi:uncharacterized protein